MRVGETTLTELVGDILKASFTQTIDGLAVATVYEDVIDPSTGEVFQKSPAATDAEVDLAVAASRRAQPAWAALSWEEREQYLNRLADALEANKQWLGTLQTMEQGMAVGGSIFTVSYTAQCLRIFGALRVPDRVLIDTPVQKVVEQWKPLGVVAAIAPWNGPILLGMQKVATALICGNTVVLKPSEMTPLGTLEIGRIARDILPPGVFNVLGGGRTVGQAMVAHSGFNKVSFTGSTATGVAIAKQSGAYLRPVILELGGNDAAILLDDGCIDDMVEAVVRTGLANRGQFCGGVKRTYVPTALYDEVCAKLVAAVETIKLGSGFDPQAKMGPIQNKAQFDKICDYVEDAKAAGGRVLTGGAPLPGKGYYYPPTIIADLKAGVRLVDEEQFGPLMPVLAYDDLDTVIAAVNTGIYGLTASIWTADLERGAEVASRLEVGTGFVNEHGMLSPQIPFPLIKASGMGVDYADHGIKGAMRLQIINTKKKPGVPPQFAEVD
jgi:acyl-CoA reductase-like NAD-dependent aldehyde dehydrogenase